MNNPIPYLIKKGDTLQSISENLGIIDSTDLRFYHNMTSEPEDGIGTVLTPGRTLLTPSQEKIDDINAKRTAYNNAREAEKEKQEEEQKEVRQQEEKQQKKEEEKQKQAQENEHEGKYFVVHKALCACNQAENPKQTAKLLVTSQNKVVFNDQKGKFSATDVDKTFDPVVASFGKCKLKPSSSGYLPCTLTPAPKWDKPYTKKSIYGNKALTELSTLNCTIGGKIEVVKNGQTDSVMIEHAENTNPAALALINSPVKMPEIKTAYPSVSNITLKTITDYTDFKAVSSAKEKSVEHVMVRPDKECTFTAKIAKGNVNLTSWMIYDGFTGDKDKRLLTSEQIGIMFKNTFPTIGKYRVEGYGKPKTEDFEGGKCNKNFPDCSIDIEVAENKLDGDALQAIDGGDFAKVIDGKMRLRQNFPASFKAKFLMEPIEAEIENLKMYVTDEAGNVVKSIKVNNTVSFTPKNTNANYKIIAQYRLASGDVQIQRFEAKTIGNAVTGITHNATVIRPGTPMTFAVKTGTFSFFIPEEQTAIDNEIRDVKWNLNGRLLGNGRSITIPGHELMTKQEYVVEAFCIKANAYGKNAKHEEDDWHFEVKDNDVESFSYIGTPKVGKTTQLEVDRCVFKETIEGETIIWDTTIPYKTVDKKTIYIKPLRAGKEIVKCRINRQPGKALSIEVKQAKILGMLFTDSTGIEIEKSSWYQTVNIWIKQEHLVSEDLTIEIWDNDKMTGDDYCKVMNVKAYDGNLIPLTLDSYIKGKAGNWANLYVRIGAPKLKLANENNIFKSQNRLDVQDKREIYSAQIGTQDGKERHYHVDYNQISYFYGKSRGIKGGEKLKITIYEKEKVLFEVLSADISVDESGKILAKLQWDKIAVKLSMRTSYAVVQDSKDAILYNGAKVANGGVAITKKSALLGLAEYKSAVLVGKAKDLAGNKSGTCVCKDYDLIWGNKVSCEFRMKVIEICKDLWADDYLKMANNLMAVFYWETGGTFKSDVPNQSKSGATGLIQFMPERADEYFGNHTIEIVPNYFNSKNKDLHNLPRVAEFARMTSLKQLDYVKKYFESQRNKKLEFIDFYLQVLFPVSSGKAEHVVFADEESKLDLPTENKKIKEKRVSKYDKNSGFDLNKNGKIYKSDIAKMVEKYKTEGLAYKTIAECKNIKQTNVNFSGNCTIGEVVNGFIVNDKVIKNRIDSCNNKSMPEKVKIIVLHRTAGGKASGTLNWMATQGYGAHFVNDYDGKIYQAIGLDKKASHMGVNRKKHTVDNGWGNGNSIGIETCGLSLDKDGTSTLISKMPHDHWEPVTNEQAQSIACLLKFLLNHFNLSIDDIKIHEDLCLKTELEGKLVYDAMLPYLK